VGCIAGAAGVFALVWGAKAAWSILAGGGIGLIWTVYMAVVLYKHSLDYGARLSALSFVGGWVVKVALTFSLLVIAFRSAAIAPLPLLAGLFVALLAYWAYFSFRVDHAGVADGK
jgi:F0F1-type ATP synthase assembly protein I